ncbi:MAG: tetraacyldisaccharide 4'-kinase [Candidatus Ratteibacteria bacterium]|nr:tetraacyldisaccharide 4'-kinase [Candidatus Ratteibacteria bacterium]
MKKSVYTTYQRLVKNKVSILFFWPLSFVYYLYLVFRGFLYKSGIKKSQSLPCQVISIGNLTWGGTGKTPLVEFVVRRLSSKKAVVLSRGYGRRGQNEKITLVSDESRILAGAREAGDEPYLLAKKLPGRPVVVGSNRFNSGKWAINRFQPGTIILDDGFQHRSLKRNIDLVVIDSTNPFGNRWLIPAGSLREPLGQLKRAQIIFLSKVNEDKNQITGLKKEIRRFNAHAPIVETVFEPVEFHLWPGGETKAKEFIREKAIFMLAGINSPSSFRYSLLQLGGDLVGEAVYPDHYYYRPGDLSAVINSARLKKAEFIVTTEKDEVKLPKVLVKFPILILKVKLKVVHGEEVLDAWLS